MESLRNENDDEEISREERAEEIAQDEEEEAREERASEENETRARMAKAAPPAGDRIST